MSSLGNRLEGVVAPALWRRWLVQSGAYAPWLGVATFYAVFANLPYWFAASEFKFSPIGLFCVDYATVGLIALFAPRFVTAVLLLFVMCADVLSGVCESYYVPVRESLENWSAVHAFALLHQLFAAGDIVMALLIAAVAAMLPGPTLTWTQRRKAAVCLLIFAVLIVGTDTVNLYLATGHLPGRVRAHASPDQLDVSSSNVLRLARIPFVRLMRQERVDSVMKAMEDKASGPLSPMPSATGAAIRASGLLSGDANRELPNLVLVIVESWGASDNARLRRALVQPYLEPNLLAKYDVSQGTVPFYGGTVAGEARELCSSSMGYYLMKAPAADLSSCLPARLAELGYRPIALHGMNGFLFDRTTWYRTIGFQEIQFHEEFKREGLADCPGVFPGTCDADIAAWIGRRLQQDSARPSFIHWMTLNSHLPVLVPSPLSDAATCEASISLTPDTPLCSWYQLVTNVHRSVAKLASEKLARPTIFAIVGDHAPPFGAPEVRSHFSQAEVPYVILVPRTAGNATKASSAHNLAVPASSDVAPSTQIP